MTVKELKKQLKKVERDDWQEIMITITVGDRVMIAPIRKLHWHPTEAIIYISGILNHEDN